MKKIFLASVVLGTLLCGVPLSHVFANGPANSSVQDVPQDQTPGPKPSQGATPEVTPVVPVTETEIKVLISNTNQATYTFSATVTKPDGGKITKTGTVGSSDGFLSLDFSGLTKKTQYTIVVTGIPSVGTMPSFGPKSWTAWTDMTRSQLIIANSNTSQQNNTSTGAGVTNGSTGAGVTNTSTGAGVTNGSTGAGVTNTSTGAGVTNGTGGTQVKGLENPLKGIDSIPALIEKLLNIVLTIGVPIVAFFLILSGFMFVAARGNPEKLSDAKRSFIYTLIGAAILLGCWVLAQAIASTIDAIRG